MECDDIGATVTPRCDVALARAIETRSIFRLMLGSEGS